MALGLRYPGTVHHHGDFNDLTFPENFNRPNLASGIIGGLAAYRDMSTLMVAPSRYSSVRKLVFWADFRHQHDDAQPTFQVRLRVQPYSLLPTALSIDSIIIAPSSVVRTTGTLAAWAEPEIIANDSMVYDFSGDGNAFVPQQFASTTNSYDPDDRHSQLLFTEFDRFEASSEEIFNDWDNVAAMGDDDRYVAYRVVIERMDGTDWSDLDINSDETPPVLFACGFAVIQAPGNPNDTCTYINAMPALNNRTAQNRGPGSVFLTEPWPFYWPFVAADWDNITQVTVHARSESIGYSGANNVSFGRESFRLYGVTNPGDGFTTDTLLSEEDLTDPLGVQTNDILRPGGSYRFQDVKSLLVDGSHMAAAFKSNNAEGSRWPAAHFEVIQKACSRKTTFILGSNNWIGFNFGGAEEPNDGLTDVMVDKSLFDPLWYENFPDEFILKEKIYGAELHQQSGNNPAVQQLTINADPTVDMDTDFFTQKMEPELSVTPAATAGYRLLNDDIETNNPLRLAGRRTLQTDMTGFYRIANPFDIPGAMGLAYTIDIPESEFLNTGPLFDVGSFNPEGCASTSAGLGDRGLLFITNGSTTPKKFNPRSQLIEDAGVPTPFEGEDPQAVAGDTASSPTGGLSIGLYQYRYTFRNCCTGKESNPSLADVEADTTGASPAAKVTLSFAGLRIPADEQICEICIYRTLVGGDFPIMAKVGCFDPDETEIFVDDLADSELDFLNDAISILNAPPPCTTVVEEFKNRLIWLGDIPNNAPAGTVSVINGDDLIMGDGAVQFDRCVEGKYIQVEGDCRDYEILRVLPPPEGTSPELSQLRLVDVYEGDTNTGRNFTICGRPNRVYISEPLEGECVPESSFLDIDPGDGDRLMGAVANFDRIIICKRTKTYAFSFRDNPVLEINVPTLISRDIGCIGPRSFAQVESGSVWLADRGIAMYDGRTVRHLPESDQMNDLFINPDNPNYVRRDSNGRVIDAVGVFYPKRQQYLLLLPTVKTNRGAALMLVWDVKLRNITLVEFCQEFQSMVVAKDSDGNERVYMGDVNGFVWIYDIGNTDGVGFPNATGTVRGDVSELDFDDTGASFFTDLSASFITGGLPGLAGLSGVIGLSDALDGDDLGMAGACVFFRRKDAALDDPWIQKFIVVATKTKIYVTPPWTTSDLATLQDQDTEYMLGPIEFKCIFKPTNYGTDDFQKRNWDHFVVHEVEEESSSLRVELLPDFQNSDDEELTVVNSDGETGDGRTFDMSFSRGRQKRPTGREIHTYEAVRFTNFAPEEPIRIIQHLLRLEPRR